MIIVEGPDGSGKTSLVRSLKSMLNLPQASKAVSPEMKATTDVEAYMEHSFGLVSQLIYDRFALISGPIYGPLMGMLPPNDIFRNAAKFNTWLQRFRLARPLIIYCLPPFEVVDYNIHHGEVDNSAVFPVWDQAYWAYWVKAHQDFQDPSFETYIYDYKQNTPQQVANWVGDRLGRRV